MVLSLKTPMSSGLLVLFTILFHGACGTFFPPVSNPPPIPAQGVRTLDNSPQGFYVQEDLQQDFSPPLVRDEGLFAPNDKPEEQRWLIQENQSDETGQYQRSEDAFDRYYQSGEPAVGPVATPVPDDIQYIAQSSSISRLNPNDARSSDLWILTRGSDNQFVPQRLVRVQVPAERYFEVLNTDSRAPVAADTIKSIAAPVPPEVPVKTPFTANAPGNIVQQIWVQAPKSVDSQVFVSPPTIIQDVQSVQQIVDIPLTRGKQIVQQQVIKDAPAIPIPPSAPVFSKKSFSVPPPLPPPLKGDVGTTKSVYPVNAIPDSNVIVNGKSGVYQQLRHVWIPTSSRTGKFISFPVSPTVDSGKSVQALSLDSTPVTVSDTWVLSQEGPVPGFIQQQKSVLQSPPPPVVQSGKVLVQDPSVYQINNPPPSAKIVAQVDSPKNPGVVGKNINAPVSIWPVRNDLSYKAVDKSSAPTVPDVPLYPVKSGGINKGLPVKSGGINKGLPVPPIAPQQAYVKSPVPQLIPQPAVQLINGKPCPIPIPSPPQQKSLFSPNGPAVISLPRVVGNQRLPLTRIIRVNRYPTGSYYLLNSKVRPSYFTYPSPDVIQQTKNGLIRLVPSKQIPLQFQSKPPIGPVQAKQIPIPVQTKAIAAPIPARQVVSFPFLTRQAAVPLASPKSTRIIYPALQAIRYPWKGLPYYRPVPGRGLILPQLSPLKATLGSSSESSSSSEGSSESSSSESREKKEGKPKKEEKLKIESKPEKEEKSEKEESSSSADEREKESSSEESKPEEKTEESGEATSESKSEESIEAAESQLSNSAAFVSPRFANFEQISTFVRHSDADADGRVTTPQGQAYTGGFYRVANSGVEPRTIVSRSGDHTNFIYNQLAKSDDSIHQESIDMTTDFVRD